ncbi:MAG: hypothetical protein K0Q72_2599 [Armatimonadetes bacterium]|nr:hypothetical protein [Armatimonadota bacterium]
MSLAELPAHHDVVFPESDGRPIADNTLQFEWIVTIKGGIEALFRRDPNVFVAGSILWYPVEGRPEIRCDPDVLVAFGPPKGHRGSYLQWKEAYVAPQVVFEILSPGIGSDELCRKLRFYQQYGVEEYYLYDPDRIELSGWKRIGEGLEQIESMNGWVSPRLTIRFQLGSEGLELDAANGERFRTYVELVEIVSELQKLIAERERADRLADRLRELGVDPD